MSDEEGQAVALHTPPEIEEAQAFFEANREELIRQYKGKYVAIVDTEVVDAADTFAELAERVYKRFGARNIFMQRVEAVTKPLRVPSPRLIA